MKFRVYHKAAKRYTEVPLVYRRTITGPRWCKMEQEFCLNLNGDLRHTHMISIRPPFGEEFAAEYIVERSTGVEDIDGVKIFEGDLVQQRFFNDGQEHVLKDFEVKFTDGAFMCFPENGDIPQYLPHRGSVYRSTLKVIGNIHED